MTTTDFDRATQEYRERVERAAREYIDRKARRVHPLGAFDSAGRWYPAEGEKQACCAHIRQPSRRHPYSLVRHCRSMAHVANLFGVKQDDLFAAVRAHERA